MLYRYFTKETPETPDIPEQSEKSCIVNLPDLIDEYDIVLVGCSIWWHTASMIIWNIFGKP